MLIGIFLERRNFGRFEFGRIQNVEQKHRVIGHGRAPRFGDDGRMGDVLRRENFRNGFHHVHAVFVERVVAAEVVVRVGAVVIDRQSAAEIEKAHRRPFLHESAVDPGGLDDPVPDVPDVRNLRADVVVQKFDAVEHLGLAERVDRGNQLRGVEPEYAAVPARFGPLPARPCRELHPQSDVRTDPELAAPFDDRLHLARHFHHQKALDADFGRIESQVDEFVVLVSVADQAGFRVAQIRDRRKKFRFASGFESVMQFASELRDLFDHLLLLVDLDRIDSFIDSFVSGLFDGFGEALVQKADLGVEDVSDPQQNRHVHAAFLHAPDDVHQTDGRGTRFPKRCHGHFAVVVDCEVSGAPVVDPVKVCGIANGPPFQRFSANVHFPILSIFIHRSVKSKVSEV